MGNVNRVLDHRVCIPISLSMVYLLIRQRLILLLYGIGMPEHFLVT
ncbi:MAG: transglutaminase-like domain-containing protein [Nitrospira sp.]|nr:transglutaminase-like domain-containing protein [Nitrospira sp.]